MESSIDISQLTKEVLVSSDMYGQAWNICVWDYNTGTNLQTYKNCSTIPQGLEFLKQNYMLAAPHNKPYLLYWNMKGKVTATTTNNNVHRNPNSRFFSSLKQSNSQQAKINVPGFVNCLTTSNCGRYIALGIDEKVHIMQVLCRRISTLVPN